MGNNSSIKDNIVFDNWSVNIYVDNKHNVTINKNLIYCNEPDPNDLFNNGDKSPGDWKNFRRLRAEGIMTADEKNPAATEKINITNNIILGCRRGITHYGHAKKSGLRHVLIANNTIVVPNAAGKNENFIGIKIPFNRGNNHNTVVRNNIIYATHPKTSLLSLETEPASIFSNPFLGVSFDHNLWYHQGNGKAFFIGSKWISKNHIDFKTWKSMTQKKSQGIGSKYADPLFASPYDYSNIDNTRPLAGSAAINGGVAIKGIIEDYSGKVRNSPTPSIGAFEFN